MIHVTVLFILGSYNSRMWWGRAMSPNNCDLIEIKWKKYFNVANNTIQKQDFLRLYGNQGQKKVFQQIQNFSANSDKLLNDS